MIMNNGNIQQQCDLLIFGAGGHAKVVSDCASVQYPKCFMISGDNTASECNNIPILPETTKHLSQWRELCPNAFVAIGNNARRELVQNKLIDAGFTLVTLVHPSAIVSSSVVLGVGTLVCPGAIINADVHIGKGCIVNSGAIVEHECKIGDFSHISPGAHLGGGVVVGRGSWICLGTTVSNNVSIGDATVIAAGAAVLSDVPSSVLAAGVPAEIKKTYSNC
jgi:sugar O-acyltransferase (sialic acid O-acetyltransferase NeuD family)